MAENVMLNKIKAFEKDFALIKDPYKQVDAINRFCYDYMDSMIYTDLCFQKIELSKKILRTINYPKGKADTALSLCYCSWAKARHDDTKRYGEEATALFTELGDKEGQAAALTIMAYGQISNGNYEDAIKKAFEAIRLCQNLPSSVNKGWAYYSLGVIHFETKDYSAALKVAEEAYKILIDINYTYGLARGLNFLASIHIALNNFEQAHKNIIESIPMYREVGHDIGLSRALNDLGVICRKLGKYAESEKYLKESYQIRESVKHAQGMITTSYELGELMIALKKPEEALQWLTIALNLCKEIKTKSKEFQVHKAMAEAYKQTGDYLKAYSHLEQFVEIQSVVVGQNTAQRLKQVETKMATEKAEKEAEIERLRNVELKQAHDIISTKNKEIVDSINYAWRIQSALLSADNLLKSNLCDYFVLFKPKDIVSGDFYWASKQGDNLFIAVCDSTGHGVPGAFMSILNATYLNEAITEKGLTKPNKIFDHVRKKLIENISQEGQKDGMDGILLHINGNQLNYAAAYNSPLLISKKGIIELGTDKMPVGKGEKEEPFNLRTIKAKKGDMLYLYTDGYADQFGGPNGKKLKYKVLEDFLVSICHLSLAEQKVALDKKFADWKGDLEQVDDVLVMGIKI